MICLLCGATNSLIYLKTYDLWRCKSCKSEVYANGRNEDEIIRAMTLDEDSLDFRGDHYNFTQEEFIEKGGRK